MAGERIRHNTTQTPVNTTLENVAWGFLIAEMAVVTLLWVQGWYWLLYTSFVLLALLVLDWTVMIFINWRLGKIKAYQSELKGYQEEQESLALVYRPGTDLPPTQETVREVVQMWSDVYSENDFTDTSEFRIPLSNIGEEHDVRTDANQVRVSGTGTDSGSPPGSTGQAGTDGGAFGRSWGAGGWSHASGDGGHRTTDDGPSTRIDLHQRDTVSGEDEPTVVFDASGVTTTPPGLDVRGIRFSQGRTTRQPARRDPADQSGEG